MKTLCIILGLLLFPMFMSCKNPFSDSGNPCKDRMNRTIKDLGKPSEINKYDSDGYHSESWWWWDKGLCYTWSWGDNVDGCDKSTYKFNPITGSKVLISCEKCR